MNPVFIMVTDLPKVKATLQAEKLKEVQRANQKVSEWIDVVEQNIGYCEESPTMAELGKVDALTASKELAKAAKEVLLKVEELNDGYQ